MAAAPQDVGSRGSVHVFVKATLVFVRVQACFVCACVLAPLCLRGGCCGGRRLGRGMAV